MKGIIWYVLLLLLPATSDAEIYKWKDKDGSVRYSDIPPPSDIKKEPMLGNKIHQLGVPAAQAAKDSANQKLRVPVTNDEEAAKRAKDAEAQKKADETKRAELKLRQENCAAAKRNQAMYNVGGRIANTDAQGERRFLADDEIEQGRIDAAKAIEKFCID